MAAKKIALFIDADNISAKFGKQIIDTLDTRGEIFIRRIYGNWEKISLHGWNECILNLSLRAIQQPDFVTGKNATDMSLVIDAMDVLHDGKAEIFALVSNDSDFTPLAIRLREGGMKVIGFGNSQAANSFRAACQEFIDLDAQAPPAQTEKKFPAKDSDVQISLFEDVDSPKKNSPATFDAEKIQAIHDALREANVRHGDAEGFVQINYGRLELRGKNFDFTVKDFGYGQLKDFIVAFPDIYEFRGEGKDFCYRCKGLDKVQPIHGDEKNISVKDSIPPPPPMDDAKLQQIHNVLHEAATCHGDAWGFTTLTWAGEALRKKNIDIKNSEYGTLSKFVCAFTKRYEIRGEGAFIAYRCRVVDKLQPIHDVLRETVKLHGDAKGFATLSKAGNALSEKNFSLKGSGHATLKNFLDAFPKLYEVKGSGAEIFYRCRGLDKLQPIHDVLREVAKLHGDAKGFTSLSRAGNALSEKNFSLKGSGHATLKKFLEAFPKLYEVKGKGANISYRCR